MRTRLTIASGVLAALAFGAVGLASFADAAAGDKPQTVTVRGEVVDLGCYLRMGAKGTGPDHQACAIACSKMGIAHGILDARTGEVYVSLGKSMMGAAGQDTKDFVGKTVEATGEVHKQKGVQGIAVTSIKEVK